MNDQCSIELLESALAGTLSPQDEHTLGAHLEACAECSVRLESLAGGPGWRQHAAALLVGDELDESLPARDEWWDVDFSVEHLEPSDDPSALGRVGPYDILEIVGRGGMGVVLKGFDRELKRCVAIKVLAPHLAQSSLAKKRFTREAQAAAAIVHPNVLAIHQVQPGGRLPYLVMPFVAGESLAQRLAAQGTLELKEILRIGMQAAAGLAAAHEQGLVHRDVKPANILLEKGVERAVITDFGLARAADDVAITRLGIIAGTPQYMSPEQARGEPLDGRSDLFSLGCVLYELATGVSPFRADSAMATMRRLVDEAPQALASLNPELPPWFCAIVNRLLEKIPARRFGSAKEVSELLEGCLAHLQQPTGVPLPVAAALPGKPSAPRSWWPFSLRFTGVLIMLSTLGIALATFLTFVDPPELAGVWSGPAWDKVVLKQVRTTEYTGSYSIRVGDRAGEITLSWSRLEGRFVGTWREYNRASDRKRDRDHDRFGEISLRLVGAEIRGTYTQDPKSDGYPGKTNPGDFVWARAGAGFQPIVEREVSEAIDFESGKLAKLPDFKVDDTNEGIAAAATWTEKNGIDACFDAQSLLTFGTKAIAASNEDWEEATPALLADRIGRINPPPTRLRTGDKEPATYLIQTREGSVGLVQVLGFRDGDKTALKIRYKLGIQKQPAVSEGKTRAAVDKATAAKSPKQAFVDGERRIAFTMNNKPWREVIDWVVEQTGLTRASLQHTPDGSFEFSPAEGATFSFPDVIDIINERLHPHYGLLIRRDTSFSIVSVANLDMNGGLDANLVPRIGIDELSKRGATEVVQILVTRKKGLDLEEFHSDLVKQIGPLGDVQSLKTSDQVLVRDQAGMLRRLMKTMNPNEPEKRPAAENASVVKSPKRAFLDGERRIAFAMNDKPWREVIDWIVDQTGLVYFSVQAPPNGTFKFISPKGATYSFPELIDIINDGLHLSQQTLLIRRGTAFSIISADERLDPTDVPRVSADELGKRGRTEIVQILVPLKGMNANEFAPEVKRQLSSFGSVVALISTNQLIVTDSAGNLQRLMKTINLNELEKKPAADPAPRKKFRFPTTDSVQEIAYSPDDALLAIAGDDTNVSILDAKTGALIGSLKTANAQENGVFRHLKLLGGVRVVKLAFSPDSKLLAIGNNVGQVKLFDAGTGALLRTLAASARDPKTADQKNPQGGFQGGGFGGSFPGQFLGKGGKDFGKGIGSPVQWFDGLAKGRDYFMISEYRDLEEPLTEIAKEQGIVDSKITRDQFLKFFAKFDVATLPRAHGSVHAIAFSPDGATLATSGLNQSWNTQMWSSLVLWDVKTGARRMEDSPFQATTAIAFSIDGKYLAAITGNTGPSFGKKSNSALAIFDAQLGKKLSAMVNSPGVVALAFLPDGKRIAVAGTSGIRVVYPASGVTENTWPNLPPRTFLAFSPDGTTAATRPESNVLHYLSMTTGDKIRSIDLPRPPGERWDSLVTSPRGGAIAVSGVDADGKTFIDAWDAGSGFNSTPLTTPRTDGSKREVANPAKGKAGVKSRE